MVRLRKLAELGQRATQGEFRLQSCTSGGALLIREQGPQTHLQVLPVKDAELFAASKEMAEYLERVADVLERLAAYFTSGDDVPVDRAVIKTEDFWKILGRVGTGTEWVAPRINWTHIWS